MITKTHIRDRYKYNPSTERNTTKSIELCHIVARHQYFQQQRNSTTVITSYINETIESHKARRSLHETIFIANTNQKFKLMTEYHARMTQSFSVPFIEFSQRHQRRFTYLWARRLCTVAWYVLPGTTHPCRAIPTSHDPYLFFTLCERKR